MKIGIDIDEVIAEFMRGFFKFYKEEKGKIFQLGNLFDYYLDKPLKISMDEAKALVRDFHKSKHFDEVGLVDEAKESILKLSNNNKIFFITSRHEEIKSKTEKFIQEHFSEIPFEIFFSGDIWQGTKSKRQICREEGIKLLLEDNKDYAFDCARSGIKVILFDKPWNRDYEEHENIIKVNNWEEALDKIKEIEDENTKVF